MAVLVRLSLVPQAGAGQESIQPAAATCADCHPAQSQQFARSVHAGADMSCAACHGGLPEYPLDPAIRARFVTTTTRPAATRPDGRPEFDHGDGFLGRPARRDVPARCGVCHSDVARMNPYGLRTDQVAQHRNSGHGRALYERQNERAAVCIDCHGTHDILRAKDPESRVYPKNVPATCGRCHSDAQVMQGSGLSTRVVEEYRASLHGQALLEGGDVSMPHCAVCHGGHSAVPPGFQQVGHVCGRCHPQEEARFMESPHARFEFFPRCVACHTRGADVRDHRIVRIAASPKVVQSAYEHALMDGSELKPGDVRLREAFRAHRTPAMPDLASLCQRCHNADRQTGHRVFFAELDRWAVQIAGEIDWLIPNAEMRYAATSRRVDEVGRGVLLVRDEALMRDELRTKLVEIGPIQHTLDLKKISAVDSELRALADQIDQSLDSKLEGLRQRHTALLPMWGFIMLSAGALWIKYKRLKAALVKHQVETEHSHG